MKRIIKSAILSVILFHLPLLASELPNREGGKFGTISTQKMQLDEVSNKKTARTKRSFRRSSCKAEYAVRVRNSNYGVTGITRIYPAQRLYGCRGTISIGAKLIYLGSKPIFYTKTFRAKTRYNTSYYRPKFTYRWYGRPPTFARIGYLMSDGRSQAIQYVSVPGFSQTIYKYVANP